LFNYAIQSWHLDEDSAWDIIYKVLFKITERIANYTFKNEIQFRNMMYSIFNNELVNFYRKSKRIQERIKLLQFDDSLLEEAYLSINHHIEKEINEKIFKKSLEEFWDEPSSENILFDYLNELLDSLDDWERILVNLRAAELSYQDITKFVDKPVNQLKVYYGRIVKKVQIQLLNKMKDTKNE
jgi:DNA-directed RNA polymerase specialized sigma24 family protein